MKRVWVPLAVLVIAIAVWFSTMIWLPAASAKLQATIPACQSDPHSESCVRAMTKYGVTGDLFGAVNALFSGLALFAVAWTLWLDSRSRREAKRPLLVLRLDDDAVTLDEPNFGNPKTLRLEIDGQLVNMGDAALNVSATARLRLVEAVVQLETYTALLPMAGGAEGSVSFKVRLESATIRELARLLSDGPARPTLHVQVDCTSLESVCWRSSVTYVLEADHPVKLKALLGDDPDEFARAWGGGAAFGLKVRPEAGSWTHAKASKGLPAVRS